VVAKGWEGFADRKPQPDDLVIPNHSLPRERLRLSARRFTLTSTASESRASARTRLEPPEPVSRRRGGARRGEPHHAPEAVPGSGLL
jgi:hypothetical protein